MLSVSRYLFLTVQAYYTIAHLLQGSSSGAAGAETASYLSGSKAGLAGIPASALDDAAWNYIFLNKEFPDYPAGCAIPKEKLDVLRNEFEYWYPLDLRVSGKGRCTRSLTHAHARTHTCCSRSGTQRASLILTVPSLCFH